MSNVMEYMCGHIETSTLRICVVRGKANILKVYVVATCN